MGMGLYDDDGRGGAFSTSMKLFHLGLLDWCPAEVSLARSDMNLRVILFNLLSDIHNGSQSICDVLI